MSFFTSLHAKQLLTKELEDKGYIKCKLDYCSLSSTSVAESIKHIVQHGSAPKPETVNKITAYFN